MQYSMKTTLLHNEAVQRVVGCVVREGATPHIDAKVVTLCLIESILDLKVAVAAIFPEAGVGGSIPSLATNIVNNLASHRKRVKIFAPTICAPQFLRFHFWHRWFE